MSYRNNIIAMEEALAYYNDENRYAILLAQMQSGKTMTYRLIACEMIRQKKVERVVIFSGTSDKDLKGQTDINLDMNEADKEKFTMVYLEYLESIGKLPTDDTDINQDYVTGLLLKIKVVWGSQMKRFEKKGCTLFIWEESHYAQSQNQGVDKFLSLVGIDATGGAAAGDYALSVSATPFSELVDNHHLTQTKKIIRYVPGEGYVGVKTLYNTGRIQPYSEEELSDILDKYDAPGYVIMRAPEKMAERVVSQFDGWCIEYCDMDHKMNLNDVLRKKPSKKTVIFVKGMLRMGKVLDKTHILCVIETGSKTDTILQGLLGRCCGYYTEHIVVYVKKFDKREPEIKRYIRMTDGEDVIPSNAMNVKKRVHQSLFPCIPLKITRTDCVHGDRVWEDICPNILEARTANDIVFHETEGTFWRDNTRIAEMRQRIKEVLFEAQRATLAGEARGSRLVLHKQRTSGRWGAELINAYRNKVRKNNFEVDGRGGCGAGGVGQVVVWEYSDTELYITMQFPISEDESIPETTGKEVFCREPEPFVHGGFVMNVGSLTRANACILESELRRFIQLSRDYDTDKKITKNGNYNCIKLTPHVFGLLIDIKERLQLDGVLLGWKKKTGKKDPEDVCLSEINWRFE